MALNRTARRVATLAIALAATTGIGTASAATTSPNHGAVSTAGASAWLNHRNTAIHHSSVYDFSTHIANVGGQPEIDACAGGLTEMIAVSQYMGRGYYPIHNECGGAPILELVEGSLVHVAELGAFIVIETLDVMRGDDASVIKEMAGDILLQTCHNSGEGMRVVALRAIGA